MQGGHAGPIHGVGIGANRDEVLDRFRLRARIPPVGISRVMKRLCSLAIPRPTICSVRDQQCGDLTPKCRRGHMESRVASIEIVSDVGKKEGGTVLACRAYGG